MTPQEYIDLARATDHESYALIQERLSQERSARLFHYFVGAGTEAGELLDAIKKSIIYGKPLDVVNLKEECGDLLWYIARACDCLGFTFEEVMELNINKLKARYGEKFTEDAALNRDLDKERAVLEMSNADV